MHEIILQKVVLAPDSAFKVPTKRNNGGKWRFEEKSIFRKCFVMDVMIIPKPELLSKLPLNLSHNLKRIIVIIENAINNGAKIATFFDF